VESVVEQDPPTDLALVGGQGQRQREDADVRVARLDETLGVADVLAEDQPVPQHVEGAGRLERLLGGEAVRGVLGVGDGEVHDRVVGTEVLEALPVPPALLRRPEDDAAERVGALRHRIAHVGSEDLLHERGVRRREQVERCPLDDALGELPGRAEVEVDGCAGLGGEHLPEGLEGRPEVGGCRDEDALTRRRGRLALRRVRCVAARHPRRVRGTAAHEQHRHDQQGGPAGAHQAATW
jgi:hypothetical protein